VAPVPPAVPTAAGLASPEGTPPPPGLASPEGPLPPPCLASPQGPPPPAGPAPLAAGGGWAVLRERAGLLTAGLRVPLAGGPGMCAVCRCSTGRGSALCFQCRLHSESAPGLLADVVAPAAYAPKGGRLARDLWLYKTPGRPGAGAAAADVLCLLLVFLHEHGQAVWQRAGMTAPTHACVVPSARGRPGIHPLRALLAPHLALPWLPLRARPGGDPWARLLDPDRFGVPGRVDGASVVVLDDTWTSGGSAQSAALALKRAGARSVAVVVAGRHMPAGTRPGLSMAAAPGTAGQ
jgi:hypothetical protein